MKKESFEHYLQQAQALRNEALVAEFALLAFLAEFEASDTWRDAGFNTFARLLDQHNLTRPSRFEEFKAGLLVVPAADAQTIGVDATIQAAHIKNGQVRTDYITEAKLRVRDEGFPWSKEQAERTRIRIAGADPKPPTRIVKESRLERALAEAEALIETLQLENLRLKEENAALKKSGSKATPPAKPPTHKHP